MLSNNGFVMVMHCSSTKETWDTLHKIFEGDAKVKEAKLQTLREKLEGLKMRDEEKIAEYIKRIYETTNTIRGLGEEIKDEVVVNKELRSLTPKYCSKVSEIEEEKHLKLFTMDELYGSLAAYDIRTIGTEVVKKEATFNTSRIGKEESIHDGTGEYSNDIMEKFVTRLKMGSRKYKGKLPLKCFNYGKNGHFAAKCPYADKNEDDQSTGSRSYGKDKKKNVYRHGRRGYQKKRSLFTHENDTTDEESTSDDYYNEDEVNANLFMAQEVPTLEEGEEEEEKEGEIDLEAELISALEN